MSTTSASRSRALSQVISAIILSAVVIAVGGAVWAFSQGAMTITAEDYAETVINMTDVISERFIIEMVWYESVSAPTEFVGNGEVNKTLFYFEFGNSPVVTGSEIIKINGIAQIQGEDEDYTIDHADNKILFAVAPTDGLPITADYKYLIGPLDVWIFNYGTVDIEVKVQVKDTTYPAAEDDWFKIPSKDMKPFQSITLDVISKEELNIKSYTKRGNNAYYRYIVP